MADLNLQPFLDLGFTNLEATIYCHLLENSPATGYGIAKGTGKPAANTYKALESLQQKGGIIIEDDRTRLCRAVPPDELFDGLTRQFTDSAAAARAELAKLKPSPSDTRIYQLKTPDQVIAKYRSMLASCERVVMLDLFPFAVKELRKDMIAAAKRGVSITVKVYEDVKLPGVKIIKESQGDVVVRKWPGQWANGVFDGEEYLLAFLSRDCMEVYQAVWSNSHFLSWIYYGGFANELIVTMIERALDEGGDLEHVKRIMKTHERMLKLGATGFRNADRFFRNE